MMASTIDVIAKLDDNMARALRYALNVIESYEMDIRNSQEIIGHDLVADGFCQGSIYTEARATIRRILEEGLRV